MELKLTCLIIAPSCSLEGYARDRTNIKTGEQFLIDDNAGISCRIAFNGSDYAAMPEPLTPVQNFMRISERVLPQMNTSHGLLFGYCHHDHAAQDKLHRRQSIAVWRWFIFPDKDLRRTGEPSKMRIRSSLLLVPDQMPLFVTFVFLTLQVTDTLRKSTDGPTLITLTISCPHGRDPSIV